MPTMMLDKATKNGSRNVDLAVLSRNVPDVCQATWLLAGGPRPVSRSHLTCNMRVGNI